MRNLNISSSDSFKNIIEHSTRIINRNKELLSSNTLNKERLDNFVNEDEDDEIIPTIDIGTQTSFYLSEVDPMTLEDDVLLANFCDQDERLVCLVCYKIFPSTVEQDLAIFKKHLSSHKKASLKKVRVHQRPSSSISPCYSDDVNHGKYYL